MRRLALICLPLLFLAACGSSTNITNSWKANNVTHRPINKVMIIGLMTDKDRTLRQEIEQQLAGNLAAEGYSTTSAYFEYGPKSFQGLKEQQVLRKLRSSGIDGVITVTLLDKNKEENYVPGRVSYYPTAVTYNRFWGYYSTYYNRIYQPGYYTSSTKYFLETNLYDVKTNQLIYSAQSETFDPSSTKSLAADYSKVIVKDMKQKDLLKNSKPKS